MRVVLDVSTSLAWTRPPVGIVRAERKFAAFLREQTNVERTFCRFDAARACYVEVSSEVVRALGVERERARPTRSADRRPQGALAAAVKNGIARLPRHLRQDATLLAGGMEQVLKSVYWLGRSAWREWPRRRTAVESAKLLRPD